MHVDAVVAKMPVNPFANLIGLQFTRCQDGECSASVQVRNDHFHPGGVVHGGVAFALADSTMATAITANLPPHQVCSTIQLKIAYLAPVREGTMRCDARTIRKGRRVAFMESKVYEGDRLVATATATFAIVDRS